MIRLKGRMAPGNGKGAVFTGHRPEESPLAICNNNWLYFAVSRVADAAGTFCSLPFESCAEAVSVAALVLLLHEMITNANRIGRSGM